MWNGMVSLYSARSFGDSPLLHWQFQVRSAWERVSGVHHMNSNLIVWCVVTHSCSGTYLAVVHERGLVAEGVAGGTLANAPGS